VENGRLAVHIPGMTKRTKIFWMLIGYWTVFTLPCAALLWIAGYDKTIRVAPFPVACLVFALAVFWWSSRGKNLETPKGQL